MRVHDDEVEPPRVHPRMLDLHDAHPAAVQRRPDGGADAAAGDGDGGQRRTHGVRHRGERRRPEASRDPSPRRAGTQRTQVWREAGRFGKAERLRLQPRVGLAEHPG